ncbi:GEVED domain-containing protein [uncultured Thiothrix sp.]|uniref:GEVED domain-containing protein n=1 Tax=uncultured Thiothrix sp. TaxID=223185 RepID=UPI0026076CAD|nr:GEVED domain-containing protein [uncultured Thiothrix sp.]
MLIKNKYSSTHYASDKLKYYKLFAFDLVPYWSTVPNSPSDGASFASRNSIELWQNGFLGVPSYEGQYFAELNADVAGALYQDSETSPGTVLHWSFAHRGRAGNDTINLKIGSPGAEVIIASFTTGTSGWKLYSGTYTVPAGQYITRFAFQANGAGSYGNFVDSIDFKSACPDWSDAPASYGDASHQQVLSMKLGTSLTTDAGPYHDANANADPSDDGVTFSTLALGRTGTINVAVSNSTGYLQAWFDLNNNGSFDAGEQIAINARDGSTGDADGAVNGVIKLNLPIPVTYPANYIFSRFRWSSTTGLGATGDANDGEVEDYKTTVIRTDFGDAPASYGNAVHNITTNLYLGLNALDAEAVASPPLNGTGDNITGVNDENGVVNLPVLSSASMGASVNVIATNTTTSKAWLVGWLDWNQNGIFDAIEAATVPVEVGSSQKVVGLTWKGFSGLTTGTTYLRLRLTTDPNIATGKAPTSQAQGIAADGEVEDYAIVVNDGGYELSGQVFLDTNVNAANDSEAGIKDVSIVLYNTVTHTCVATKTDANGQYHFINVANGSYELYEAAAEKIKAPKVCPPVAHDSNGYQSSTANSFAVTVNNNDETGLDFGDVKTPIFSIDNQKSILPNTTITYPHTFHSFVDGIVSFSVLDEQATPANLDWGTSILLDNNCDGKLGQGDAPLNNALAVSVDTKVCILVKVHAPSAASEGAQHSLVIQSDFQFGAGDVISNDIQTHTDFTTTVAGTPQQPVDGAGKLQLEKSVWNVTRNIDGTVALPGETLRYTLHYENIGNGLLNDLAIQDSVPEFTQLVPNSLGCGTTPPELTTCTPQVSATSLEWVFTGQLKAGSKGSVSYQVIVE